MTDKKDFDQEELKVAFERLNKTDDLQPSAELDAMILQMAADEVQGASTQEEKSNVTDISDISFRRGQRESHTSLKKKGLFPNWVMPIGLAATVLLSFGVVNRVLLSPEFGNLTKQSSYEAMSDEVIITSSSDTKVRANKDVSSFNKPEQSVSAEVKKLKSERAKTTVTVNGNEINADISFAEVPSQPPAMMPPPPKLDTVAVPSAVAVEHIRVNEEIVKVENSVLEVEADIQSDSKQRELDSRQEQHALLAKEKRERLTQARRSEEPEIQMAPTAGFSVAEPAPAISSDGPALGNTAPAEQELAGAFRLDNSTSGLESADSEIQAEAMPSFSEMESVDEVVVTGSSLKNDSDVLADKAFEAKRQVLQSVLFEHKQCLVNEDCALVALACDSCDCLEPVNNQKYNEYQSEFSQTEIAEQCINTSVECVRNYCQVQETD